MTKCLYTGEKTVFSAFLADLYQSRVLGSKMPAFRTSSPAVKSSLRA